MELGIQNKIALVAAGTRGIGLATAKALADEGALVSICGTNPDNLAAALKILGPRHRAYRCDLSKKDQIDQWVANTEKDLGTPNILVTNTGGPPAGAPSEVNSEKWQHGFENTLLNIVRLMEVCMPKMKELRWGRVIHITSLVAKDPSALLTISSTLRVGISALTKLQAQELGPFGITVNSVLPGHTNTDRQTHLLEIRAEKNHTSVEVERKKESEKIPLKRMAEAKEIGDVIAFLCSQRASYVTGTAVVVDGGSTHSI